MAVEESPGQAENMTQGITLHKLAQYGELPLKFPYLVPLDFWGADRKTLINVQLPVSL